LYILDTINTLQILDYNEAIELLEKSVGVFLMLIESGFDLWSGEIDLWNKKSKTIDKEYYLNLAKESDFEQLDKMYNTIEQELRQRRIHFIRGNLKKFEL
jgi:hypothetical protein